mmetsp:Transcript_89828/g.150113  ORF Transcript_89828/g.150113 Transcript_89828/m.150113 type:complete len:106 (+) Transcript_89828:658-975(+)
MLARISGFLIVVVKKTICPHVSVECVCAFVCFALMTPGVKSVEITSLKTSNASMHFVCAFDSPTRLKTAGKVENFPVRGKVGLNLVHLKCQHSAYTTRATAFLAL